MNNICTILLISYNHASYIRHAIESVLEQKTNYPFVIHVFDDASTDGSSDIIREYAKKYPDKIIPFIAEQNKGAQGNIWAAYKSVKTKYCALLECDDYWCDENKLELQIKALENHPECSFCACNTRIINTGDKTRKNENKQLMVKNSKLKDKSIFTKDFFNKTQNDYMNHIASRIIRTSCFDLDTLKYKEAFLYDNCQFYYLLTKGDMYYIDRVMHCYLQTGEGSFSSASITKRVQTHIKNLLECNEETNFELSHIIFFDMFNFLMYYIRKQFRLKNKEYRVIKSEKIDDFIDILQRIKRYFIPKFILDIINIPFNIIKFISRKIRNKGEI